MRIHQTVYSLLCLQSHYVTDGRTDVRTESQRVKIAPPQRVAWGHLTPNSFSLLMQ